MPFEQLVKEKTSRQRKTARMRPVRGPSLNGKVFPPLLVRKLALPEPTSFFRSTGGRVKKEENTVAGWEGGRRDDTKFRHNCTAVPFFFFFFSLYPSIRGNTPAEPVGSNF